MQEYKKRNIWDPIVATGTVILIVYVIITALPELRLPLIIFGIVLVILGFIYWYIFEGRSEYRYRRSPSQSRGEEQADAVYTNEPRIVRFLAKKVTFGFVLRSILSVFIVAFFSLSVLGVIILYNSSPWAMGINLAVTVLLGGSLIWIVWSVRSKRRTLQSEDMEEETQ